MGNALTGAARLGLKPRIISKVTSFSQRKKLRNLDYVLSLYCFRLLMMLKEGMYLRSSREMALILLLWWWVVFPFFVNLNTSLYIK